MSETAQALIHKPVAVYSATLLYSVGGNRIAKFGEITAGSYSHDVNRANVRRAADCWNACLGIDDPAAAIEAARKALEAAAKQFEFMLSIMDQKEGSEFYTNASSECKSRLGECSAALNLLGEVK